MTSVIVSFFENFSEADTQVIKDIEKTTNHDVKAVEYFLKERFELLGLGDVVEFIHFGLTSQDINNTAIPLSLKESLQEEIVPLLQQVVALVVASERGLGHLMHWNKPNHLERWAIVGDSPVGVMSDVLIE